MKRKCLFVLLSLVVSSTCFANIITNGSFEDGLNGWTTGGTQISYLPAVIVTNGVAGSAFGEVVPAADTITGSDDAVGTHGVYFVDDLAQQFLTQSIFLTAGSYEIGFDAYSPLNGWDNTYDATFTAIIAGVTLANYSVQSGTYQEWVNYSGVANILGDGFYDVTFEFTSFGVTGADVVIDRAFVIATDESGVDIPPVVSVPEPGMGVLFALGLGGLFLSRRKKTKSLD